MTRFFLLVATSVAISTAGAQADTRSDAEACADSNATGMYRRCALWVDGGRIRRGDEGVVVGRPGFFRPMALARLVAGDSAKAYAALFEHRSRQSGGLGLAGGVLMVAGYIVVEKHYCRGPFGSDCNPYDNGDWVGGSLYVPGLILTIASGIVQSKAHRARAKSVWWNNERFSR